jgi:pyruvate dehydrogenase E2 component (dihydrolipoamide acetyltransferase)
MPKVDMVMEAGTFVEWLKAEGDLVSKGEPLFVILTDKASMEIDSPAAGILASVKARSDDVIPVAATIAYILEPGESLPSETSMPTGAPSGPSMTSSPAVQDARPEPAADQVRVRATPVARRLAAEFNLDLGSITGTGSKGRIHRADVLAAAERRPSSVSAPVTAPDSRHLEVPLPDARRRAVMPLAGPRKIIAERMALSAKTAPHINLSLDVDMSEAVRLREKMGAAIQERTGRSLSFTALIARCAAAVLPSHPFLNASLSGESIVLWEDVHLGIATSLDDYLIVPVIRQAQTKNLTEIAQWIGDMLERARAKRLTPAEMTGSTFTISNLGMYGIDSFTAIINPPEAAILAVGQVSDRPVRSDAGIALRPFLNLTLCADHRIVDGAAAARFLAELKSTLENPYLLL